LVDRAEKFPQEGTRKVHCSIERLENFPLDVGMRMEVQPSWDNSQQHLDYMKCSDEDFHQNIDGALAVRDYNFDNLKIDWQSKYLMVSNIHHCSCNSEGFLIELMILCLLEKFRII
jgi:hypothetical protein